MDDWVLWMIAAGVLAVGEIVTLGSSSARSPWPRWSGGRGARRAPGWRSSSWSSRSCRRRRWPSCARSRGGTCTRRAQLRTGTAALVGTRALVLERVDADGGCVKIGGEVWTARAYDEDEVIEPGTRVDVLKIEGATALVSE